MSRFPNASVVDPVTPSVAQGIGAFSENLNAEAARNLELAKLEGQYALAKAEIDATAEEHRKYQEFQSREAEKQRVAETEAQRVEREYRTQEAEKEREFERETIQEHDRKVLEEQAIAARQAVEVAGAAFEDAEEREKAFLAQRDKVTDLAARGVLAESLRGKTFREMTTALQKMRAAQEAKTNAVTLEQETTLNTFKESFLNVVGRAMTTPEYRGRYLQDFTQQAAEGRLQADGTSTKGLLGAAERTAAEAAREIGSFFGGETGAGFDPGGAGLQALLNDVVDDAAIGSPSAAPVVKTAEQKQAMKDLLSAVASKANGGIAGPEVIKGATEKAIAVGVSPVVINEAMNYFAVLGKTGATGEEMKRLRQLAGEEGLPPDEVVLAQQKQFDVMRRMASEWRAATGANIAGAEVEQAHLKVLDDTLGALQGGYTTLEEYRAALAGLSEKERGAVEGAGRKAVGTPAGLDELERVAPGVRERGTDLLEEATDLGRIAKIGGEREQAEAELARVSAPGSGLAKRLLEIRKKQAREVEGRARR